MKKCSIVIGSLWGDEGKGHMTDILCNEKNTLNIRFNGGSQASHTVVTPDNKRHSFHHFGAGTFTGAKTYLSEDFIVNPISFVFELNELFDSFKIKPHVFVNPNAIVTTPWDMYLNQGIETYRDNQRHGSCGYGINETVERSRIEKYKITVMDLFSEENLINKLLLIQNEYIKQRLEQEYNLTISDLDIKYQRLLNDQENISMFLFYVSQFLSNIQIVQDNILNRFDNIVFEGAQGLLLDQNNTEYYPHVTTSNTGIKNVMDILASLSYIGPIDIYYMSRCYITKHGAGAFKGELKEKPYSNIEDLTNIPNEFQGSLRFGYMDFDLLAYEINKDLRNLKLPAKINITFTCLDQLDDDFKYLLDGKKHCQKSDLFVDTAFNILKQKIDNLSDIYATNGLTRHNFIKYTKM
ncbi:MAG: adenylosuccinate synthase [Clostridiales bacterium]|nr:adenylosuccinate synthase [Clostridiales bacterium]